jgi:hypothetical protein
MVNGLEIYVIYCIALARMLNLHLRLNVSYLSIRETLNKPASASDAGNSGIPASLFYMDRLIIGLPYGLPLSAKILCSELVNTTKYI